MLDLALNQSGVFRLIYSQKLKGDLENRKIRAPMIEPLELPITLEGRVLVVSAVYFAAPPSWNIAGTLFQQVGGVGVNDSLTFGGQTSTAAVVDTARRTVRLNTTELHVFPRYATEHSYRFEAVRWMPEITFAVWEYTGPETDSTEELIQITRVDLARIENKINQLTTP